MCVVCVLVRVRMRLGGKHACDKSPLKDASASATPTTEIKIEWTERGGFMGLSRVRIFSNAAARGRM